MNYEQLKAKYGSPLGIALALGFCTEKSSKKRKDGAVSRVCNWKRTQIPARQLKRILELDK